MLKGNKGEWSEIYAFCYILSSGILQAADKDLNPIEDIYFPVIKIIRDETGTAPMDYFTGDTIKVYQSDNLIGEFSKASFNDALETLLAKIPEGSRAFEIPEVTDFFDDIKITKLKADSAHKQDIDVQVHDIHTGISPVCGFSIKSYLGSNPTLINAGNGTNFVYTIENCDDETASAVNAIDTRTKIIDRIAMLHNSGCELKYEGMCSTQFGENMQFVDSLMPQIVGHALMISYRDGITNLAAVVNKLKSENPLNFSNVNIYEYKIKKLLSACALGMTPETLWEGAEDANGGYIVVKNDGSVVCYYLYNRTDFDQYLYDYTYFERASTSRYGYANVYKEDGKYKFKLNLQVRFKEL